jgi:hypothetical protein
MRNYPVLILHTLIETGAKAYSQSRIVHFKRDFSLTIPPFRGLVIEADDRDKSVVWSVKVDQVRYNVYSHTFTLTTESRTLDPRGFDSALFAMAHSWQEDK